MQHLLPVQAFSTLLPLVATPTLCNTLTPPKKTTP